MLKIILKWRLKKEISVSYTHLVYLQPSLASQGVKGTVTNALASAFVGSLGGGKSFCNNLLVYYAVLFGGQAVILDPKAERGNWKETLPEIAHEINIVNLTSDKDNAGLLDPFVIMKNVKDCLLYTSDVYKRQDGRWVKNMDMSEYVFSYKDIPMLVIGALIALYAIYIVIILSLIHI